MLNISIPPDPFRTWRVLNGSGEYLVLALDHAGFALSTKSARNEGDASSHVVLRLAEASAEAARSPLVEERAKNTLRISLGRSTTRHDLHRLVVLLQERIEKEF